MTMEKESSPSATTSWLTRTHFSRAVCYRPGSVSPAVPLPSFTRGNNNHHNHHYYHDLFHPSASMSKRAAANACIQTAPSLDAYFLSSSASPAVRQDIEEACETSTISTEADNFSFPSPFSASSPTSRHSDSSYRSKGTSDCFSPSSEDDASGAGAGGCHRFSMRSVLSSISINPARWSFSSIDSFNGDTERSPPQSSSPKVSWLGSRRQPGSFRCTRNGFNHNESKVSVDDQPDMHRVPSWSQLLSKAGGERAVLSAKEWMVDLSQLLLGERFACGTHSRLYKGIYRENEVAVKVIRKPDDDEILADRLEQIFMQEVMALSCSQLHRNVIKFYAACKKPPVLCVITEYLPGGSLRSFLRKREGHCLDTMQLVRMALDIASGMEYLHMKGVIHRDLKSENLVLAEDDSVKVVDFGVSCFESNSGSTSADDVGTYRWMAPELLRHQPHSRKVDVYSFGIVLWELVTTRLPYEGMEPAQAAFCVLHKESRPPIPSDCPAPLADLMQQCWSADPETRPEFWEIMRALATFERSVSGDMSSYSGVLESPEHHRFLPGWLQCE